MKQTVYDHRYLEQEHYWGNAISEMAVSIVELHPSMGKNLKVLEIGCGEGTNAVFLAKNGYDVTAFDLSKTAVEKTNKLANQNDVRISTFIADINDYLPVEKFDIVFSSGTLQYLTPGKRANFIEAIKQCTNVGGLHVLHTFAHKAYVPLAPDAEASEFLWQSGELLQMYQEWKIERFVEEVKSCNSGGTSHEHAHNRIWARKI